MLGETDDMETIGYDLSIWKEASDQTAIGTTQIDTHHFDSIPAFEPAKEGKKVLGGFTGYDIEDAVFSEITEGGGETLLLWRVCSSIPSTLGQIKEMRSFALSWVCWA